MAAAGRSAEWRAQYPAHMTDDQGYGVSGTFGGVIPTPALDRIATAGLRYTEFNSTALCSPTRAALITGRNHHSVGFGVIAELSTGYPGYDLIIGPQNATIGTILRDNGYATSWFGKNHNTPGFQYSASGPYDQWPSGMGFDYFYGFMGGETDQWTPYLFRDHTQIYPVDRQARLQPHHRHGGRGDQAHEGPQRRGARSAVLRLLRSRRKPLAAPAERKNGSTSSRASSTWAGTSCASKSSPTRNGWGSFPRDAQLTPWPDEPAEMGDAVGRREEALRPAGRGVRRLHGLHRPRDRPRHPGGRGSGQTRQHADHLHRR